MTIGNNCVIQTGAIIGHDDFAYTEDECHRKKMIKHYGGVDIGNDVYFGPACIVNRGTIDDTVVGDGCKIDARCIVSHNVNLGKNSTLIAGSILHGSVKTGNNVYIASAIIKNQLYLGENAFVGLGSVVTKDVEENTTVAGIPAKPLYR